MKEMGICREILMCLDEGKVFTLSVHDKHMNRVYFKTIRFVPNPDDSWDMEIIDDDNNPYVDYPDGIIRNLSKPDIEDIVTELFYTRRAAIKFSNKRFCGFPTTEFNRIGTKRMYEVEEKE